MKLVICIVQDQDVNALMEDLTQNEFRITKLSSTGGFLKAGNSTLLIGVEDDQLTKVYEIIERNSSTRKVTAPLMPLNVPVESYMGQPIEITVGGATIFTIDVEEYLRM